MCYTLKSIQYEPCTPKAHESVVLRGPILKYKGPKYSQNSLGPYTEKLCLQIAYSLIIISINTFQGSFFQYRSGRRQANKKFMRS